MAHGEGKEGHRCRRRGGRAPDLGGGEDKGAPVDEKSMSGQSLRHRLAFASANRGHLHCRARPSRQLGPDAGSSNSSSRSRSLRGGDGCSSNGVEEEGEQAEKKMGAAGEVPCLGVG